MKTHIIALAGLASVGKDTVADLLVTHAGFKKFAFADALRAEVAEAFEIDMSLLTDRHTKETPTPALALVKGPREFQHAVFAAHAVAAGIPIGPTAFQDWASADRSPRQILQWWGTEYRRASSPNYWILALHRRVRFAQRDGATRFVISDCRMQAEADLIRAIGGSLWAITRAGISPENTAEGQHATVNTGAAFAPDLTLHNDYDIKHLQGMVRDAFLELEWPEQRSALARWAMA